jgi:uncharacterized membrane protein HdeD (DUF308 family)
MSEPVTQAPPSNSAPPFGGPFPMARVIQENLKDLRDSWFWFVLLGIGLVVLGLAVLTYTGMVWATLATALVLGIFMMAGGLVFIVGAFFTRGWGGFFLSLFAGVLYLAAGFIITSHPVESAIVYTLLLAVFFIVEGLFRIVAALAGAFRHWGWMLVNGVITVLLGVLIWEQWPDSGLYVIGLFLGINLIVNGSTYISLGLRVRKLPVG